MIIEIMSKEDLLKYSFMRHDETVAVISITNHDGDSPMLLNNPDNGIEAQCYLRFNDSELGMYNCITDADAEKAASFANEIVGRHDRLIVQCGYGVSRSAAVAAAIMKHFADNDMLIWNNPIYRPNVTCYKKVMVAFKEDIDEQELNEKIAINRGFDFAANGDSEKPHLILINEDGGLP